MVGFRGRIYIYIYIYIYISTYLYIYIYIYMYISKGLLRNIGKCINLVSDLGEIQSF